LFSRVNAVWRQGDADVRSWLAEAGQIPSGSIAPHHLIIRRAAAIHEHAAVGVECRAIAECVNRFGDLRRLAGEGQARAIEWH
jgi:hypothetical protein